MRKKIVHDPYVFAGPLRSALPPPLRIFLPFGLCVIVGHGLHGHVALHHCARMFVRLCALWVIVGHSLFITHKHPRKLYACSLWAVCAVVGGTFSRAQNGEPYTNLHTHIFFGY